MNLHELMSTTPESLAEKQRNALEAHIIRRLTLAIEHVKSRKYTDLKALTFSSPAGDGYGMDNDCIDFAWDPKDCADILQAYNRLEQLDNLVKSQE